MCCVHGAPIRTDLTCCASFAYSQSTSASIGLRLGWDSYGFTEKMSWVSLLCDVDGMGGGDDEVATDMMEAKKGRLGKKDRTITFGSG